MTPLSNDPTAAHHIHGKVEQNIWQIKESVEKTVINKRLSVLQWKKLAAEILNSVKDLPIATATGPLLMSKNPKLFLQDNEVIFNA